MNRLQEYKLFEKETQKIIYSLNKNKAIIFAGACCERMINSYDRASEGKIWRNVELFNEGLDAIWDWIVYNTNVEEKLIYKLEAILPDEGKDIVDEAAISSVLALSLLIEVVNSSDFLPKHIRYIIGISDEVLDQIYQILCSETDGEVDHPNSTANCEHEFMFLELQRQRQDLEDLANHVDNSKILKIRNRSKNVDLTPGLWYSV